MLAAIVEIFLFGLLPSLDQYVRKSGPLTMYVARVVLIKYRSVGHI